MRNRKSLLGLGLFALVLVLGVGYAVVSGQNLSITGTATTAEEIMDVYFKEAQAATKLSSGVTATGNVTGTKPLTATITVSGLDAIGDYAEVTYVVANDETDLAAQISEGTITVLADEVDGNKADLNSYYTVTTTVKNSPLTIAKGSTGEVTVRVELAKLPITQNESKANITIELDAEPVQQ